MFITGGGMKFLTVDNLQRQWDKRLNLLRLNKLLAKELTRVAKAQMSRPPKEEETKVTRYRKVEGSL